MMTTWIELEFGIILKFLYDVADIKGAYIQNGPAHRDIFPFPPKS